MNIYVNGDSFTSGQELLDYALPDYPGNHSKKSYVAKDADQQWASDRIFKGIKYFGSLEKMIEKEKSYSWAGQLSNIDSNLKIINGAKYGSSMTGIAHRTLADLLELKNQKIDMIFIQLTSPMRIEFYNSNLKNDYFLREKALGWIHFLPDPRERKIAENLIEYHRDSDFSIKYLYTLCGLKNFIKGILNIEPIFLTSQKFIINQVIDPIKNNLNLSENALIKRMIEESEILKISENDSIEYIHDQLNGQYTPLGHYEADTHKKFAKHVYKKYIKKNETNFYSY